MARVERFSQSARRILLAAQDEAERLQNGSIEPSHILLAMFQIEGSVAYRALSDLKIDYDRVVSIVKAAIPGEPTPPETLDLAPESRGMIEDALRISRKRGDNDLGSEHLLLALVKGDDKSIRFIMRQLNLDPQVVRSCVERTLQEGSDNLPPTRPFTVTEPFEEERETPAPPADTGSTPQGKVLQLVDEGKISALEGAELLSAMRLSSVPIPETGGLLLLPIDHVGEAATQTRTLRFSIDGRDVSIPFETAQTELLRLLRAAYTDSGGLTIRLGELQISLV